MLHDNKECKIQIRIAKNHPRLELSYVFRDNLSCINTKQNTKLTFLTKSIQESGQYLKAEEKFSTSTVWNVVDTQYT